MQQKPAYCGRTTYKLGVRLDNAGKVAMMGGAATMLLGGAGAAAGAPIAGVGAAPGLGLASFGATLVGRGALLSTAGNVPKAVAGDSSAIPSLAGDIFTAVTDGLSNLSKIGQAITGIGANAATDATNAAAGIGNPSC